MSQKEYGELQQIHQDLMTFSGMLDALNELCYSGQTEVNPVLIGCSLEMAREYLAVRTDRIDKILSLSI